MRSDVALHSKAPTENKSPVRAEDPGSLAVDVEGVSKSFRKGPGRIAAVSNVTLNVDRGEFVALVGPSGCGKSTLLRVMAGLSMPTEGEVRVGGTSVEGPRSEIGLMLQHPTLFPWRTVLQNVLLPLEIRRRLREDDKQRARELIHLVGLERFEEHYPRELSGGMQQRAALCRLLISNPSLMLLDEPFGALDEFTREKLNVELANVVTGKDASVLLVTHNIAEAIFLADRVVALGGSPGVVRGDVSVGEFTRPRPLGVMRTTAFQEKVAQVRKLLGLE